MKKILCLTPLSWATVPVHYHIAMLEMKDYGIEKGTFNLRFAYSDNAFLDYARDELAQAALKTDIDYFLWIDADQVYPRNTPEILMAHVDSGKLVVGGITPRSDNGLPMIRKRLEDGTYCYTDKVPKGLFKVDAMGMGGVMTHRSVFEKLKYPYFMMRPLNGGYLAESLSFFERCNEAGIETWCDTTLQYVHMEMKPVRLRGE